MDTTGEFGVVRRTSFEPPCSMEEVDAALRAQVEASRRAAAVDAAIASGEVPVVVVPGEVVSLDGARLALQASLNTRN